MTRCWMSSSSSMPPHTTHNGSTVELIRSLHLIEHGRKCAFHPERFLYLVRADIRILAVLQEAWPLVVTKELDHRRGVCPPVLGPALQIHKYGRDTGRVEKRHGILDIFVEIRIEDA